MHQFPGGGCGVPTIVDHYLIQSAPLIHGVVVLDITRPDRPVEVSRLTLSDTLNAHWTGWNARTGRLAATGYLPGDTRLYLLKLDLATGKVSVDGDFKDASGKGRLLLPGALVAARMDRRRGPARGRLLTLTHDPAPLGSPIECGVAALQHGWSGRTESSGRGGGSTDDGAGLGAPEAASASDPKPCAGSDKGHRLRGGGW